MDGVCCRHGDISQELKQRFSCTSGSIQLILPIVQDGLYSTAFSEQHRPSKGGLSLSAEHPAGEFPSAHEHFATASRAIHLCTKTATEARQTRPPQATRNTTQNNPFYILIFKPASFPRPALQRLPILPQSRTHKTNHSTLSPHHHHHRHYQQRQKQKQHQQTGPQSLQAPPRGGGPPTTTSPSPARAG